MTLGLVSAGGCAQLPRRVAAPSLALPIRPHSRIGRLYSDAAASHPGQSGFVVLDRADQALDARAAVIELADSSIDAQYFDWESDRVGQLLYDEILRAADRGVRVRLLIDDIHVRPRDRPILALDGHPNIEVRIFNPFIERRGSRALEWLRRFSHVNHRMHNKMLIVDGQALVVGGRNIADSYFGFDSEVTFRDLDLLAVGALALDAEQAFDLYWNSPWAFPIGNLHRHNYKPEESAVLLAELRKTLARTEAKLPRRKSEPAEERLGRLDDDGRDIVWAPGELVYDRPEKIAARKLHEPSPAAARTALIASQAQHELVVEAAYFVPPQEADARSRAQAARRLHSHPHQLAGVDGFGAGARRICQVAARARRSGRAAVRARRVGGFALVLCRPAPRSAQPAHEGRGHRSRVDLPRLGQLGSALVVLEYRGGDRGP